MLNFNSEKENLKNKNVNYSIKVPKNVCQKLKRLLLKNRESRKWGRTVRRDFEIN